MSMIPSFFGRRSDSVFDPFSLEAFDPFDAWPFNSHFRQLSENIRSNFPSFSSDATSFAHAMVDWRETPNSHVFKADLPGLRKEEVKVELEDDRILQISGERKREMEQRGETWHRVERSSGRFVRRFRLPENAKLDAVKASMENGVLIVTVPKVDAKKPEIKNIDISG